MRFADDYGLITTGQFIERMNSIGIKEFLNQEKKLGD